MAIILPQSAAINWGNPVNRSSSLSRGLQAWWLPSLASASSTIGRDMQSGISGALSSSAILTGSFAGRKCYSFTTASSNRVLIGQTGLVRNVSTATIACWVRLTSAINAGLVGVSQNTTTSRLFLHETVTGGIQVGGRAGDAESAQSVSTTATYADSTWHHFLGTVNYSLDSIAVYVDGVAVSTSGTPAFTATATSDTDSAQAAIGAAVNGALYSTSQIDDVRIWNRDLSADEVYQVYVDSLTGYQRTLNRLTRIIPASSGAAAATFNPGWARNSTTLIGAGSYA